MSIYIVLGFLEGAAALVSGVAMTLAFLALTQNHNDLANYMPL